MSRNSKTWAFITLFGTFLVFGCASKSVSIPKNFPDVLRNLDPKALASVTAPSKSKGDGFFFSYNGCLITIRHFKDFSVKDSFTIWNGSSHIAKVAFDYSPWDLVVLKVNNSFPKVPIPVVDTVPKMGETVYAITRSNDENFEYITGAIMLVDKNAYVILPNGDIAFIPGAFAFWSDTAAQPGWSGSYVTSESGGVGYLFASDLKNFSYFHPVSYGTLNLIFPNIDVLCP